MSLIWLAKSKNYTTEYASKPFLFFTPVLPGRCRSLHWALASSFLCYIDFCRLGWVLNALLALKLVLQLFVLNKNLERFCYME